MNKICQKMGVVNFFSLQTFYSTYMSNRTEMDHSPWQKKIYLHLFQFLQCKTERRHIHDVKTSKSTEFKISAIYTYIAFGFWVKLRNPSSSLQVFFVFHFMLLYCLP